MSPDPELRGSRMLKRDGKSLVWVWHEDREQGEAVKEGSRVLKVFRWSQEPVGRIYNSGNQVQLAY